MVSRSYGRRFLVAAAALALLAWTMSPVAAQEQRAPFECNASLELNLSNSMPTPGEMVTATIRLINGPSTDGLDQPIPQDYSLVSFFPNCTGTVPCTPDPAGLVSFVSVDGFSGPGCPAVLPMINVNDMGTQVDLTFTPDPLTVQAAAVNTGSNSCTINLTVQIDPMAMAGQTTNLEADTVGTCTTGGGQQQSATGTSTVTVQEVVPTLSGYALAMLALVLAAGSWLMLRRRSAASG